MCICIYVYMLYVYMYVCIYVYMYICIYVYMSICQNGLGPGRLQNEPKMTKIHSKTAWAWEGPKMIQK